MTGDEVVARFDAIVKTNAANLEAVAARAGVQGAREAMNELMPEVEKMTKKIVDDARNSLFMAATGEEWKERSKVKDAIQWSIHTSNQAGNIGKGFLIALGGGAAGALGMFFSQ